MRDIRRALRELLASSSHSGAADVAELLTSELVTNALIHTDRGAVVTAVVGEAGLRVEVKDFVTDPPTPYRPSSDDGTHGRGLLLVEALADGWGVHEHDRGKIVWFEIDGVELDGAELGGVESGGVEFDGAELGGVELDGGAPPRS